MRANDRLRPGAASLQPVKYAGIWCNLLLLHQPTWQHRRASPFGNRSRCSTRRGASGGAGSQSRAASELAAGGGWATEHHGPDVPRGRRRSSCGGCVPPRSPRWPGRRRRAGCSRSPATAPTTWKARAGSQLDHAIASASLRFSRLGTAAGCAPGEGEGLARSAGAAPGEFFQTCPDRLAVSGDRLVSVLPCLERPGEAAGFPFGSREDQRAGVVGCPAAASAQATRW